MNTKYSRRLYHKADPDTSKVAAEKMVASGNLQEQESAVYRIICWWVFFKRTKEFTAKELNKWWGDTECGDYPTIQRRLSGLCSRGKIERTGDRRNGCCVWRIV